MPPSPSDVLAQPTRARLHAALHRRSEPARTAELAAELGLRPGGVRLHLEQLEAAGLAERITVPTDRGRPHHAWRLRRPEAAPAAPAGQQDIERLAELRAELRRYLAWAEATATRHDTTPAQFQLGLAIQASDNPLGPTITDLAETLLLRHHSVVGLVDRAEAAGVVTRTRDPERRSQVHVRLTDDGEALVARVAAEHMAHLATLAPHMQALWATLGA